MQDKAEDASLLAQVKDDNEVLRQPPRRTCLDICLNCYNTSKYSPERNSMRDIVKGLHTLPMQTITHVISVFISCVVDWDMAFKKQPLYVIFSNREIKMRLKKAKRKAAKWRREVDHQEKIDSSAQKSHVKSHGRVRRRY